MKKLLIASALLLGLLLPIQVKAQNIFSEPDESLSQSERWENQLKQQRWQDEQRQKQRDLEERIDELERKQRGIESDPAQKWLRQMQRR